MQYIKRKDLRKRLLWLAAMAMLLTPPPVRAGTGTVVAMARAEEISLHAFARVEPVVVARLKAPQAGVVAGLGILPGEELKAGVVLGHLQGPAVEAEFIRRRSAIASAETALDAASRILVLEQERRTAQLNTLKEVYQAEAAQAKEHARLDETRAQMRALQAAITLRAPASGTVLSVETSAGEQVEPGQTLLTLQPKGGLWVVATFYGADAQAVLSGQTGKFTPASGGGDIPVKVRAIIGTAEPGGGRRVGLAASIPVPRWRSGALGTVTLKGGRRTLVAVPTRSLILDQGKWWVLVHTPQGNQRQVVQLGPSRGESTFIEKGLQPGTEIVVDNAYLLFHRDFSRRFQAPD